MRLLLAAPALLLVSSCTGHPPPVEPTPIAPLPRPPAPTATTSAPIPAPSASASAEPQHPLAPPEVLARLTPDQRTELAVLAALCQPAVAEKDGKLLTGCTTCPSRSAPASDPRAELVPADVLVEPQAHVHGAFTAKGTDEHLVMMNSCSCNGCLDDAYVVRPDGAGGFALHRLAQVRSSYGCKVVRRRGQVDRALCDRMLARMGYAATTLELYDFSSLPEGERQELTPAFDFTALDDLALSCAPGAHFVRRSLTRWALRDVDGDGEEDLVVDVQVGDGIVTKAVLAACSPEDESAPRRGALPPMREVELTWTATPAGFKPTAATAKRLQQLEAARKKTEP